MNLCPNCGAFETETETKTKIDLIFRRASKQRILLIVNANIFATKNSVSICCNDVRCKSKQKMKNAMKNN